MKSTVYIICLCLANFSFILNDKPNIEKAPVTFQSTLDSGQVPKAYELFSFADSVIGVHGYKQAVDMLLRYESAYSDPMEKSMFNQVMMTYLSYAGDIKGALKYEAQLSSKKQPESYSFAFTAPQTNNLRSQRHRYSSIRIRKVHFLPITGRNRSIYRLFFHEQDIRTGMPTGW